MDRKDEWRTVKLEHYQETAHLSIAGSGAPVIAELGGAGLSVLGLPYTYGCQLIRGASNVTPDITKEPHKLQT